MHHRAHHSCGHPGGDAPSESLSGARTRRLLSVSDLHLSGRAFAWLVACAHDYDVIVIAGDTLNGGYQGPATARPLLDLVEELSRRTTVVIASGNHDLDGTDHHGERAVTWAASARRLGAATDGDLLLTDDLAISVCPWWDGPHGTETLCAMLRDHADRVGSRRWMWVHHAPATGSTTAWDGVHDRGDALVPLLIDCHQPDLVVSGHVHEAPFVDGGSWHDRLGTTRLLNAGQLAGAAPSHIVIDLEAETATWSGHPAIPGTAEVVGLTERMPTGRTPALRS